MRSETTTVEQPTEAQPTSHPLSRRAFLLGSTAAAGLALYSGEFARHEIDITHRTFSIGHLPPAFHGFRFVQISDIHLEGYTEAWFLRHVIHQVNELQPEMVLLTGDFMTKGRRRYTRDLHPVDDCAEIFKSIKAPLRYAILGNHDVEVNGPAIARILRSAGTPVLVNQHVAIERGGDRLWLAGLDDCAMGAPSVASTVPSQPDAPVILMAHEPDYADTIRQHPQSRFVDLVLSGHSHGGQVRLPFMRPLMLPPLADKYYEGHYQLGHMQLYVNRGIGTVGVPYRLFCPPEITVVTLQPKGLV